MTKYKSWTLVNGKPGWVIVDDLGYIINNNPGKEELESLDTISARIKLVDFDTLEKQYGKEFADWARKNKGKVRKCLINAGCKTEIEYLHSRAQRAGFKDYNERQKLRSWKTERNLLRMQIRIALHILVARQKSISKNIY